MKEDSEPETNPKPEGDSANNDDYADKNIEDVDTGDSNDDKEADDVNADSEAENVNADDEDVDVLNTTTNDDESPSGDFEQDILAGVPDEEEQEEDSVQEFDDVNTVVDSSHKKNPRKVKVIIFVVLLTIIALLVGGYLGLQSAVENAYEERQAEEDEEPVGPEAPIEQLPESEAPIEVEENTNVFSSLYSGDPSPYEDSEQIEMGNDRFVFSGSQVMLEADNGELVEGSSVDCVLENSTDICYSGYAEIDDLETIEIYAVKNIVENRLFERMSDNTENVTVVGAEAAVTGTILSSEESEGNANNVPMLAIAAENGSGFMLTFSPNSEATLDDLREQYASEFTVHQ